MSGVSLVSKLEKLKKAIGIVVDIHNVTRYNQEVTEL